MRQSKFTQTRIVSILKKADAGNWHEQKLLLAVKVLKRWRDKPISEEI